ncbi:NUDIX domain-containing protein [Streptomyces lasiicapitis]|uniref:NUDIX domain-containing protein n=1 Tax=Streptomyces lasiicapitis TaxID=1923961 RepID=UPI00364876F5
MHSDIDQAFPPRRRLGAQVLVRTRHGEVLMVKPRYMRDGTVHGWRLPGGDAHMDESVAAAATRGLHEETGVRCRVTHALLIDQVPTNADGGVAEGVNVVVDGGTLSNEEAASLTLPEGARKDLYGLKWVAVHELEGHVFPRQSARI